MIPKCDNCARVFEDHPYHPVVQRADLIDTGSRVQARRFCSHRCLSQWAAKESELNARIGNDWYRYEREAVES